jgi:hypothetical protein
MRLSGLNAIGGFFLAVMLSVPLWGANSALPGTLNYVEGQAAVADESLNAKSIGSVTLQPGQTLTTGNGKAEVLLTPGVFLRVGDNSTVTMVSPNLTNTEVGLDKGTAMVEVAQIYKDNFLLVKQGDSTTQLLKNGLYQFDADQDAVRVFKGEAEVSDANQHIKVKEGRELDLNTNATLKARKFDKDSLAQSDLYRFSSLRSEYLAQANVNAAGIYATSGWYGPGWYWDPIFTAYTWIPGDGFFYSPFGWGFYSPRWAWRSPFYGAYYGRGFYRGGYYGFAHGPAAVRPVPLAHGAPAVVGRPVPMAHDMPRSSVGASHGFGAASGGFHGGNGGFHGGGARR